MKKERETAQEQLGRVQRQLGQWRAQHGGRGRRIPDALWAAAAAVASKEGVEATARALTVDRARLCRRMEGPPASAAATAKSPLHSRARFVEVDAGRVFSRGQILVRLTNREGEQLEIGLDGGAADAVAVASAFWDRCSR
jgi:hypothetical protein